MLPDMDSVNLWPCVLTESSGMFSQYKIFSLMNCLLLLTVMFPAVQSGRGGGFGRGGGRGWGGSSAGRTGWGGGGGHYQAPPAHTGGSSGHSTWEGSRGRRRRSCRGNAGRTRLELLGPTWIWVRARLWRLWRIRRLRCRIWAWPRVRTRAWWWAFRRSCSQWDRSGLLHRCCQFWTHL